MSLIIHSATHRRLRSTAHRSAKSSLLLIPMILAATAAFGDALPSKSQVATDGQAQAAALLSRPQSETAPVGNLLRASSFQQASADGHQQAAALLSGPRSNETSSIEGAVRAAARTSSSEDGHVKAAALLSRSARPGA